MSVIRLNSIKHYQGPFAEMPQNMPSGDTYFATDTNKLYNYGPAGTPLVISGSGDGSSSWDDLEDKPTLFDGAYSSLSGTPTLFDGDYNSLTNTPTTTAYASLTGVPAVFDESYNSLSDLPTLFDEDYNSLTNKPTLFDGQYSSLSGQPSLFSGAWGDLSGAPAVDTTDDAAFDRLLVDRVETNTAGPQYAIKGINDSTLNGAFNIGLYGQSDHTGSNMGTYNYGAFNKGRFTGTNGINGGTYGSFNEAEYRGSDPNGNNGSNFIYANYNLADVTSVASGNIGFMIGNKTDSQLVGSSATVGSMWGDFTAVKVSAGTVTGETAVQELSYTGGGALTQNFSFLKIGQPAILPAPTAGTAYAINSTTGLVSRFYGRINIDVISEDGHQAAAMSKLENTRSTVEPFMYGHKNIVRQKGTGGATNIAAATFEAEQTGSGPIDFLSGPLVRVEAKGNGTSLIDYIRGADVQSKLNSSGTTITNMQGLHTTCNLTAGTANDIYVHVLDFDKSGGTIDNNFAYIKIQNDTVGTVGGTARAISSSSLLPSVFDGSIEATELKVSTNGNGIVLKSPNGTSFTVTVSDAGVLTVV
jgi:hypothetical protein